MYAYLRAKKDQLFEPSSKIVRSTVAKMMRHILLAEWTRCRAVTLTKSLASLVGDALCFLDEHRDDSKDSQDDGKDDSEQTVSVRCSEKFVVSTLWAWLATSPLIFVLTESLLTVKDVFSNAATEKGIFAQHLTLAVLVDSAAHSKPTLQSLLRHWVGDGAYQRLLDEDKVSWLPSESESKLKVNSIAFDSDGLELVQLIEDRREEKADTHTALVCCNDAHVEYVFAIGNVVCCTGVRFLLKYSESSNEHNRLTTDLGLAYSPGLRAGVKRKATASEIRADVAAADKKVASELERRDAKKRKMDAAKAAGKLAPRKTTKPKFKLPKYAATRNKLLSMVQTMPVQGTLRLVFNLAGDKGPELATCETETNGNRTDIVVTFTRGSLLAFVSLMRPQAAKTVVGVLQSYY